MKKTILIALISFMGLLSISATSSDIKVKSGDDCYCNYGRCSYIKSNGEQCKNCAQEGSYYCWTHNNMH